MAVRRHCTVVHCRAASSSGKVGEASLRSYGSTAGIYNHYWTLVTERASSGRMHGGGAAGSRRR